MKRVFIIAFVLLLALSLCSCKNEKPTGTFTTVPLKESDEAKQGDDAETTPEVKISELTTVTGTFTFADLGQVKFEVYPQIAQQSALNFLYLAQNECFNGTIVDRVQKGFTIEMGQYYQGFKEIEMPDGAYTIKGEFRNNGFEDALPITEGALVWCRDYNDPDSASNRFMICLDTAACQSLEGDYAVFGTITEGMDIIKKIGKRKVDEFNRPNKTVTLLTVVLDSKVTYPAPDMIRK